MIDEKLPNEYMNPRTAENAPLSTPWRGVGGEGLASHKYLFAHPVLQMLLMRVSEFREALPEGQQFLNTADENHNPIEKCNALHPLLSK